MAFIDLLIIKWKQAPARSRALIALILVVAIAGIGVFVWATKTGKITPFASGTGSGTMTGHVYNREGQAINNALITAVGQNKSVRSGSDGSYTITGLAEDTALLFEKGGSNYPTPFTDLGDDLSKKFVGAFYNAGAHPEKYLSHSWLKNTGLEDWTNSVPNNWYRWGNGTISNDEEISLESLGAAKLEKNDSGFLVLYQNISNLPTGNYYFSAKIKVDSGIAGLAILDDKGNQVFTSPFVISTGPTDWKTINYSFALESPRANTNFDLACQGPCKAYFDDVKLYTVLPTTLMTTSLTTFSPNSPANRELTAIAFAYVLGLDVTPYFSGSAPAAGCNFSDVDRNRASWPFIQAVCASGITRGTSATTFSPEAILTRGQMALLLYRTLQLEPYEPFEATFTDVSKDGSELYKAVETLYLAGITSGCTTTTFCPNDNLTRAQTAIFLGRAFNNIEVTNGGYIPRKVSLSVDPGQTGTYDIYLAPTGQVGIVTGRATDTSGRAISDATVVVSLEPSISENYSTVTDSNGNFTIRNVPAGAYGWYLLPPDSPDSYQSPNWENSVFVDADQTATIDAGSMTLVPFVPPSPTP